MDLKLLFGPKVTLNRPILAQNSQIRKVRNFSVAGVFVFFFNFSTFDTILYNKKYLF